MLLLITPPLHGIMSSESGSQASQVMSSLFTITNAYSPARPTSMQSCSDTLRHAQLPPVTCKGDQQDHLHNYRKFLEPEVYIRYSFRLQYRSSTNGNRLTRLYIRGCSPHQS